MLPTTTGTTYPTVFKKGVNSGLNLWPRPAKKTYTYSTELINLEAVTVAFIRHEEKFAKKRRHWAINKIGRRCWVTSGYNCALFNNQTCVIVFGEKRGTSAKAILLIGLYKR